MDEEDGGGNQTPSINATPVVARINDLERQMLDGKLVLVDDHGKPLEMDVTNEAPASKPNTSIGYHIVDLMRLKLSCLMTILLDIYVFDWWRRIL